MSFMARNAAAMPQLVCRNCLRLKPRCLPFTSASSLIRASTFFWVALCGGGRYSPLETIWVGIGVAADAASAPATRRCSRSLSQLPMVLLPFLLAIDRAVGARVGLARLVTPDQSRYRPTRRTFPGSTKHEAIALASSPGEPIRGFSPRGGRHTRNNYLRQCL